MNRDRNCLSVWLPKLQAASLPVPRTEVIDLGDTWRDLQGVLFSPRESDGSHAKGVEAVESLTVRIEMAIQKLGGCPVFLRTGQGSGKHNFDDCCRLTNPNLIPAHVRNLLEWSEMVDMIGLPCRVWAVREWLPVTPIATLPYFGNMPLVPEVRVFIRGGKVICDHPYWPVGAIANGLPSDRRAEEAGRLFQEAAKVIEDGLDGWMPLAERVATAFADDGAWSADLTPTARGWFVTDMADAAQSFHYPDCPHGKSFNPDSMP